MNNKKKIVILGGGQAAAFAAKEIKNIDINNNVTVISDEIYPPYERPPLSKDLLLNKISPEKSFFFSKDFYKEKKINLILDEKIIKVDFDKKILFSHKEKNYKYDKLLIALGSVNREIKGENNNFLYLRNLEESIIIKEKIDKAKKLIIIGGGFIGLEIASSASQLGKKIFVIEREQQLMSRIIPIEIAKIIQSKHEKEGVEFFFDNGIKKCEKINGSYLVTLTNEEKINADLIIVGIGAKPNTDLFMNTDLKVENGILTDEFSNTSIKDVYAAGDVSNFFHPFYNSNMRLESYKHAQNHGINAAKNMLGLKTSYNDIPWMWSDQFNINIQMTGICNDYETMAQRGNDLEQGIVYFFIKKNLVIGACGIGIAGKIGRDIRLATRLSENRIKVDKNLLEDTNQKLNKI